MHSIYYYPTTTINSFDLYDECGFIEQESPFDVSSLINSPLSLDSESGNMTSSSVETSPVLNQDPSPMVLIKPPFPPTINIDDLVTSKPNGDKPSKSSNAFIIYRKAYVKELHSRGINLQMTQISPMVSESWKQEPDSVKAEYKRLAEAAKKRYKRCGLQTKTNLTQTPPQTAIDINQWDFSQSSLWSHQAISPLQNLTLDPMLLNSTEGLYNNNNTPNATPLLKMKSLILVAHNHNHKGTLLEYHQLMTNWHKDLKRQNPHPYKTFADAASVTFFALHLV
ncbi:unnamed protein product [Rhizophagus irregularis]|nr:unnamed protein product [Rhizophagus irregularis]